MLKTRQVLLENFDEAVQDKLKLRQTESTSARNRFERLLMDLTQAELQGHAEFDHEGFTLRQTPPGLPPTATSYPAAATTPTFTAPGTRWRKR